MNAADRFADLKRTEVARLEAMSHDELIGELDAIYTELDPADRVLFRRVVPTAIACGAKAQQLDAKAEVR